MKREEDSLKKTSYLTATAAAAVAAATTAPAVTLARQADVHRAYHIYYCSSY